MDKVNEQRISNLSRILLFLSSVFLVISIFVPLWRIDLDAPQYPEGLQLLIYTYKLGGNVEIINGLNHYIGMKTLHADDFIEFTVLPYIIGAFALFALITALIGKKKLVYILFIAFALFGVLSMIDFYRWEYDYGHNLDPNAAIVVPGMAYQPPLIGFKQLLNFGAFSIPSYGGWLFIICGVFMLAAVSIEAGWISKFKKQKPVVSILLSLLSIALLTSCVSTEPQAIKLNTDNCDYCKMSIADGRFGTEVITKKGRAYKFDDISCLHGYITENKQVPIGAMYVADFATPTLLTPVETAFYVKHADVKSPMGGNVAAFSDKAKAEEYAKKLNTSVLDWKSLNL
ncbi:MAG TPA: nitrous oxide reductase accessory protein NosL [Chitinophagales bacterium]|nr:nitrous oxide reductase accessory protein NosL [Chitinophagales bacterium]